MSDAKIVLSAEDRTRAAFGSLHASLAGVQTRAGALSAKLGALLPVLTVASLAAFAKSNIDAADALNDLSERTGVAVKDLASLKLAAQHADTSLDAVGAGIARLTRSIGEAEAGNVALADTLRQLGITSRDPREAFFQLADGVAAIADPSRRAVLLNQVLGKSYAELVPLLQQGGDGLRRMARESESFADAMVRLAPNAAKFNDELDRLKQEGAGASAVIVQRLVPGLTDTAARVRELLDEDRGMSALVRAFAGIGKLPWDLLFGDIKPAATAAARIKELSGELDGLTNKLQQASPGGARSSVAMRAIFGQPDDIRREIEIVKNQIIGLEKFGEKIYKPRNAVKPRPDDPIRPPAAAPRAKPADPLAGLLGQTDIARMQEFDRTVALLNQRFDHGRRGAEQYAQAMTILVERTFADNFKRAAEDAEFMADVLRDGMQTINDANANQRDWADTVTRTRQEIVDMIDPVNAIVRRLLDLDKFEGFIDPEILAAARLELHAQIDDLDRVQEKLGELSTFAEEAGRGIQDAFADFLFDPFKGGLDGMLSGFQTMLRRLAAEALAARLMDTIGAWGKGAGSGTVWGSIAGALFGGKREHGGPVSHNRAYLVGERGPEMFVPRSAGNIVPNDALGKSITVVNQFTISQPADRRTQEQIAVMAGASIQAAMARGG